MPEPPRLEFFSRLQRFSPELDLRDSADVLDPVRMLHDAYSLASIRRAVQITGEGVVEGLRAVRAGVTETQLMEVMDFVYRYRGAYLGFPTAVRRSPPGGRRQGQQQRQLPEGFIQFVPRSSAAALETADMVHVDTGASFNHHSADIQRNAPVARKFTAEQRRLYEIALNVQKTVISRIKPGVTWTQLHELAVQMLRDAGGYDRYYSYGIGHFIGMEVHDEGDYELPLQAGMALSIEQGVSPPDGHRVAFEDDVIVTETGQRLDQPEHTHRDQRGRSDAAASEQLRDVHAQGAAHDRRSDSPGRTGSPGQPRGGTRQESVAPVRRETSAPAECSSARPDRCPARRCRCACS